MLNYLLLALALLLATPAPAQIAPTSPGHQRAANRQALREARRTDTPYRDSHLAVTRQHLRRGSSEALAPVAGAPHVTQSRLPGLRRRKLLAEPAP